MLFTKYTFNNKDYKVYYVESDSAIVKSVKENKIWEKKLVVLFNKYINKESVVIDIGAFIGTHTIILSNLAKKVIAFEPQKLIGECLKQTINENDLDNVIYFNCGVSKKKQTLLLSTNHDGGATLHDKRTRFKKKTQYIDKYNIDLVPLDSIINEKIDVIKLDVEGHEFDVLEGATQVIKNYRPIIFIEIFSHKKKNVVRLNEWCDQNKYTITFLRGDDYLLEPT